MRNAFDGYYIDRTWLRKENLYAGGYINRILKKMKAKRIKTEKNNRLSMGQL